MFYSNYFPNYLPFSENFILPDTKETYLKIGSDIFYLSSYNTFESFDFKQNKRGGESGLIKFVKMFGNYKIKDRVVLFVASKQVFTGVIEKITNYGLDIYVIPLWGLLDFVYITDSLEFEETDTVLNIVDKLKKKIREASIRVNDINIIIPSNIEVTMTMAGRSIRDILDELESALPANYVYGVNSYGDFYFKSFTENIETKLDWHQGHFSESEVEEDYSELYSQFVVKVKDTTNDTFNVLKEIVGDSVQYPPVNYLTELIGKKTQIFEYGFMADPSEALNYAYDALRKQVPVETLKIKNLNNNIISVRPNECIETILKPINNFYEDFDLFYSKNPVASTWTAEGELQQIGYEIGYAKEQSETIGELDFMKQPSYLDCCNRTLDIYEIIVYYKSESSTDKFTLKDSTGKTLVVFGQSGRLKTTVKGFSKRSLVLKSTSQSLIFQKMRAYFTQGSRKILMNVREINYKYSKGILNVDVDLAKINAVLTGYIFNQNKKLKELEKLLTN